MHNLPWVLVLTVPGPWYINPLQDKNRTCLGLETKKTKKQKTVTSNLSSRRIRNNQLSPKHNVVRDKSIYKTLTVVYVNTQIWLANCDRLFLKSQLSNALWPWTITFLLFSVKSTLSKIVVLRLQSFSCRLQQLDCATVSLVVPRSLLVHNKLRPLDAV